MRAPNNFDGLRVIGAVLVLIGHGYQLSGHEDHVPRLLGLPFHALGVYLFFSVSGYLITASWLRTRSVWTYGTARMLRIFPALILTVVLTVVVIGPVVTTYPLAAYARHPVTWQYFDAAWLVVGHYALPGVFDHNVYPSMINGSLWSLPLEFTCYLAVPLALCVRNRHINVIAMAAVLVAMVALTVHPVDGPPIFGQPFNLGPSLWACFAAGALLSLLGGRRLLRLDVAAGLLVAYVVAVLLAPEHVPDYAWIALPYVVLAVGEASWPLLRSAASFGDLSYGLYLWAFPIQQLVIWKFGVLPMPVDLALVLVLTTAAAYASWHLLEVHALRAAKRLRWKTVPE